MRFNPASSQVSEVRSVVTPQTQPVHPFDASLNQLLVKTDDNQHKNTASDGKLGETEEKVETTLDSKKEDVVMTNDNSNVSTGRNKSSGKEDSTQRSEKQRNDVELLREEIKSLVDVIKSLPQQIINKEKKPDDTFENGFKN